MRPLGVSQAELGSASTRRCGSRLPAKERAAGLMAGETSRAGVSRPTAHRDDVTDVAVATMQVEHPMGVDRFP